MKVKMLWAAVFLIPLLAFGVTGLPEEIRFSDDGSFTVGDALFRVELFGAEWIETESRQWRNVSVHRSPERLELTAEAPCGDVFGRVRESFAARNSHEFRWECTFAFPQEVFLNALSGTLALPASSRQLRLDGKRLELPADPREVVIFNRWIKQAEIPLTEGITLCISGNFNLLIQDNRKFNGDTFSLRCLFQPDSGNLRNSSLRLDFAVRQGESFPADLSTAVNRSYADEDGSGWTGQGRENDLRNFPGGSLRCWGIDFQTDGKGAIIVGGRNREKLERSRLLTLTKNSRSRAVNLLHASAWPPENGKPVGSLAVRYSDGSEEKIPVRSGIDCGNWWDPQPRPNAMPGWVSENLNAPVGLYVSSFALKRDDPQSILFESADPEAAWMIAGVSLTPEPIRFRLPPDRETVIRSGPDYLPLTFRGETVPGSALDFSWVQDAPAGKYGFIRASETGELVFENAPEKRIRLYGPNLCGTSSFLEKSEVDRLAAQLVRCGYNALRIHHHDGELLLPGASDPLVLDPVKLDRLDYLIAVMKKHGIYLTTDFYTSRPFQLPGSTLNMKTLLPFSREAMENWKNFTRKLMEHHNPYTGLALGRDPVFACFNLVNEDTLSNNYFRSSESLRLYTGKFADWCKERGISGRRSDTGDPEFHRFLQELQAKVLDEQLRFVREELRLRSMVTSLNYINDAPLTLLRDRFDLVDNHAYFDHVQVLNPRPGQAWIPPYRYHQQCAVRQLAPVPREMMPTRIFGKPFIVTEFNYVYPNRHRAEGGPLIGAYASLQNWDGLFRFSWAPHSAFVVKQQPIDVFEAANDPLAQLSDRIAIAMFVRGDVKSAPEKVACRVDDSIFDSPFSLVWPVAFQRLGLITQIGSTAGNREPPFPVEIWRKEAGPAAPALAAAWKEAVENKRAVSSTGEIQIDGNIPLFSVRTPKTESITLQAGGARSGVLEVERAADYQTICAVSLDGRELGKSRNILLFHLTDVFNSGAMFENERLTELKQSGTLPLLVRRTSVTVRLHGAADCIVTALSADGSPLGEVRAERKNGILEFTANTGAFPGGVMAYHLTERKK